MSYLLLPSRLDGAFVAGGLDPTGWAIPDQPTTIKAQREAIASCGPLGLVALAAWAEAAFRRGGRLSIDDSIKSPYAFRTGLLHALANAVPAVDRVEPQDQWYPICRTSDQYLPELHRVVPEGAGLSTEVRGGLGYCVRELIRNVGEHAATEGGTFFAASWFPKRRRVVFAVADAGRGIRWKLERRGILEKGDTDRVALERAVQMHVTGALPDRPEGPYAAQNAGLGLYMTRRIAAETGGEFLLQSLSARLEDNRGVCTFTDTSPWTGTLVGLSLSPERLSDFTSLFQQLVTETEGLHGSTRGLNFNPASVPREAFRFALTSDRSGFGADKDEAIRFQPAIRADLEEGNDVVVDFNGAQFTTQSAMHALLHITIRDLGEQCLERLHFLNAGPQIRAVLRQIVAYSLSSPEQPVRTEGGDHAAESLTVGEPEDG